MQHLLEVGRVVVLQLAGCVLFQVSRCFGFGLHCIYSILWEAEYVWQPIMTKHQEIMAALRLCPHACIAQSLVGHKGVTHCYHSAQSSTYAALSSH